MIVNMTSSRIYQDESGQWWYQHSEGNRKRCYEQSCHTCGNEFVARSLGARTPTHCSRQCALACRKAEGECGRVRAKNHIVKDGVVIASDEMYRDDDGQWWVPRSGGARARCTPGTCHRCKTKFIAYPNGKKTKTHCTKQCYWECRGEGGHDNTDRIKRGSENHHWKGGKVKRKGYVLLYAPDHHSINGRGTKRKYVFEHRIVMEGLLGRPLRRNETVHHINGITDDNRPENLELWGYQPPGQRVGEGRHCATCTCDTHT